MTEPQIDEALLEELKRALAPVRPPEVFRDHLRHNLELASRQQKMRRGKPMTRPFDWRSWWVAVAFIGGGLCAGGALAYLLRVRLTQRPPA